MPEPAKVATPVLPATEPEYAIALPPAPTVMDGVPDTTTLPPVGSRADLLCPALSTMAAPTPQLLVVVRLLDTVRSPVSVDMSMYLLAEMPLVPPTVPMVMGP